MASGVGTSTCVAAQVHVPAGDWAAAVTAAAQLLCDAGAVSEHYVERCVEIVHDHGPYIVVAPGIAIAHARPEDGAHELGLSSVSLAAPVRFGHPGNDPVSLVFAFSSPDRDAHVGLVAALARALTAGLADRLRAAPTDDAAVELLRGVTDHE
ncbi:MAG TPA: PTS sugar transporter subunit IIA [Mycobacteriales bacterium]|nr:PTS sugar transporter subunit IIA [Mycobacteriales bacterium]